MPTYTVTLHTVTAGTMSRRGQVMYRGSDRDAAMRTGTRAGSMFAPAPVTVVQGTRHGRTIIASFNPPRQTPNTNKENDSMARTTNKTTAKRPVPRKTTTTRKRGSKPAAMAQASTTIPLPAEDPKDVPLKLYVWSTTTGKVTRTKEYKQAGRAATMAAEWSAEDGVKEVTVCQGRTRVATYRKGVLLTGDTPAAAPAKPEPKTAGKPRTQAAAPAPAATPKPAPAASRAPAPVAGSTRSPKSGTTIEKVTTWTQVLAASDGYLQRAYNAGKRKQLDRPAGIDVAKLDRFDLLMLRFLCGERQNPPSGTTRYGLDPAKQKAKREAMRKRLAKIVAGK